MKETKHQRSCIQMKTFFPLFRFYWCIHVGSEAILLKFLVFILLCHLCPSIVNFFNLIDWKKAKVIKCCTIYQTNIYVAAGALATWSCSLCWWSKTTTLHHSTAAHRAGEGYSPQYIYDSTVTSYLLFSFGTFNSFLASLSRNWVYRTCWSPQMYNKPVETKSACRK